MFPTVSPSDSSGVFALLSAVSNPQAAKTALAEITKEKEALAKSIEENAKLSIKADKDRKATEAALTKLTSEREAHAKEVADYNALVLSKNKEIVDKTAETAALYAQASTFLASAKTTQQLADERATSLDRREKAVVDLEKQQKLLFDQAYVLKTEYEDKLAKLKALI